MFKSANLGLIDRLIRLVVGILLITAPFFYTSDIWSYPVARWLIPLIGLILFVTALVRFCPAYRLFNISTRKVNNGN